MNRVPEIFSLFRNVNIRVKNTAGVVQIARKISYSLWENLPLLENFIAATVSVLILNFQDIHVEICGQEEYFVHA